ncbi:alpha-L-arabinofuranosidase C-terminal domain-containing protein [Microbispora bryophytorum]|uniref:alpha-L-arabinofuranosidase C-terminal domain-containing protein n=1 Tax=Microbispora bryophytorum TaxID=1460882 RepID=UPI0033C3AE83
MRQFARDQKADLVDEHYYNDPSWFLANNHRYDTYDRSGPHVFVGEYASNGNTYWNALTEASYLTGIERNSDVVELASYAPLLSNVDYVNWTPDLIWFDNDQVYGSPSYYVQRMFSRNVGDTVLPST